MVEWQETTGKYPAFDRDGKAFAVRELNADALLDAQFLALKPVVKSAFEKHMALDRAGGLVPPLNTHNLKIPEPALTWEQSAALVIEALTRFDVRLGQRAAEAIADPTRIKVIQVEQGKSGGYVTPSGWQGRTQADMTLSIEGSINDAVYLAHELGHLLANDFAQEAGHAPDVASTTHNLAEVQGMFMQNIFYDYLSQHENSALRTAGRMHKAGEETRALYRLAGDYAATGADAELYQNRIEELLGPQAHNHTPVSPGKSFAWMQKTGATYLHTHGTAGVIATGLYADEKNRHAVFEKMKGFGSANTTTDVLEAAGIKSAKDMDAFFTKAVAETIKPVDEIYAASGLIQPASPKAFAIRSNFV